MYVSDLQPSRGVQVGVLDHNSMCQKKFHSLKGNFLDLKFHTEKYNVLFKLLSFGIDIVCEKSATGSAPVSPFL